MEHITPDGLAELKRQIREKQLKYAAEIDRLERQLNQFKDINNGLQIALDIIEDTAEQ